MLPHDARPEHKARFPMLVTTRLHSGLPSLRHAREAARIRAALAAVNTRQWPEDRSDGTRQESGAIVRRTGRESVSPANSKRIPTSPPFQVVHHSIQSNHLHLIVEARDRASVTAGMRGLLVRIARALNRLWKRSGAVFADRFHERELRSPRQVRNALVYVLQNLRKHGIHLAGPDPLSSAAELDGWAEGHSGGGARAGSSSGSLSASVPLPAGGSLSAGNPLSASVPLPASGSLSAGNPLSACVLLSASSPLSAYGPFSAKRPPSRIGGRSPSGGRSSAGRLSPSGGLSSSGSGCSSADGLCDARATRSAAFLRLARSSVPPAATWLLASGWRRHGLLCASEWPVTSG